MSKKNPTRPNDVMKHELHRNPLFREKREKSAEEKEERKNPFSKKAKHKKKIAEANYGEGKPQSLAEFYQVGDKIEIIDGPLKDVLDRAETLRKKKEAEEGIDPTKKKAKKQQIVVREPMGPANTLGITIDGQYHIVDEEDVKLIYEAFNYVDLTEWSYAETTSGIRIPVSGEENEILNMCSNPVYKSNMDDREQEVARRMVSRGVLHRNKDEEGIFFVRDSKKLTRF